MFINLNTPTPKAIIWDWDGTIVSSYGLIHHAMDNCLDLFQVSKELRHIAYQHAGRTSLKEFFPLVFGEDWQHAKDRFYQVVEATHLEKIELIPGSKEAIVYISSYHPEIYMAIVSNKRGDLLRKEVEHLGLTGYFRQIVGAGDASKDKPSIEPLLLALSDTQLTPGPDVYIIGDSATDIQLAINAGCNTIFYSQEEANLSREHFTAITANISDYSVLLAW